MTDRERLRRLRTARLTGHVPPDLLTWVSELAAAAAATTTAATLQDARSTPTERLASALGDEIDFWMARRGVSQRSVPVPRRSLSRALAGENITIATVAEIANALGCDARIAFTPRDACARDGTTLGVNGASAADDRIVVPEG